jgi:uncharacterized protein (TIGR03435 family)
MIQEDLGLMIAFGYNIRGNRVLGGPNWLRTEKYDVIAKSEGEGSPSTDQFRFMLQRLLADRFKLAVHRETREASAYALVVGKSGPKLREVNDSSPIRFRGSGGSLIAQKLSMARLAENLTTELRNFAVVVVDETGLTGDYAFSLEWDQYELQDGNPANRPASTKPSLFTAVQEQLGLKLESVKRPVEYLIIDYAEKPSAN